MAPACDDMRVGMLFVAAWPVQVVNEPGDILPTWLVDHPDHRAALRDAVRAAGARPGTRIAAWASSTAIRIRGPSSAAGRIIRRRRGAIRVSPERFPQLLCDGIQVLRA